MRRFWNGLRHDESRWASKSTSSNNFLTEGTGTVCHAVCSGATRRPVTHKNCDESHFAETASAAVRSANVINVKSETRY